VVIGVAAVALLAAAVLAFVLLRGGGGGGLSSVQPNNVGVIDPQTSQIVDEVPVNLRPGPITTGGGVVWVGNLDDKNLTRIDAEKRTGAGTVSLDNATPTGLAFGAGGVWVAQGRRGTLSRVDPQFGQVTDTVELAGPGLLYGAVAVGGSPEYVWVVYGDSTLARVSPAGVRPRGTGFAGGIPSGVVYANGSVWVANSADSEVSRFNPETFQEGSLRDISVGKRPVAIAFGHEALWTAKAGDGTVTRIDTDDGSTSTIAVGGEPVGIAAGDGAVWVAGSEGTVTRIDARTQKPVKTISVGNPAGGIAVGEGLVWVTVQAP
jgi:streptogramin lyase